MISRSRHSERSEESPHFARGRTDANLGRKPQPPASSRRDRADPHFFPLRPTHKKSSFRPERAARSGETRFSTPGKQSWLCEVPSARSHSEIRFVHLDLDPVVLVWPRVTRNVEGYLILEELTLFIAPSVGPIISSVGAIGNLYLLRAYGDGPKRRDGLRQVVVENLEVLLLKIGDTLSGRRRNYNIEANISGGRTALTGALLRSGRRNTKHHHRQNAKHTLVDEHKLTPIDVVRSLRAKGPVRNCIPNHMLREVSSRPQWTIAVCPIHGAISPQHERTKHSLLGTPRLQPWASHSERNEALAPGVCPLVDDELMCLNAQSSFKSMPSPFGRLSQTHLVAETVGSRHSERSEESPHFVRGRTDLKLVRKLQSTDKPQSNLQSTTPLLTPKIKWNQTQTVRRKPDCTI